MTTQSNISKYQQQALDFLNATSTAIAIKFKKYAPYFSEDKESRNIYRIRLVNKLGSYNFDFGQSINGTRLNEVPSAYDVLACLQKYDVGSFEDFCSEFGYDNDSRKAEKTYKAVCEEFEHIDKLFSAEQMDLLQEIQ